MQEMAPNELEALELQPITASMIADCQFCTRILCDPHSRTPVHCTKWSGARSPIMVNLTACMTCGEYKK
ncbi:hypothetical protein [Paenibacillus puerhi]|uniref:hypothetical protein n=1 Tax=Paenibacillus puerhi TaxID=2692622 RepID=UPI001356CFC0|nr:hypothetical protein [Paenibacillus puerhi]